MKIFCHICYLINKLWKHNMLQKKLWKDVHKNYSNYVIKKVRGEKKNHGIYKFLTRIVSIRGSNSFSPMKSLPRFLSILSFTFIIFNSQRWDPSMFWQISTFKKFYLNYPHSPLLQNFNYPFDFLQHAKIKIFTIL